MTDVSFGEWLKRQRNTAGLTQEQLAQRIHCSSSALRKFESEDRRPSAEVIEQLAEIFNIPPAERISFMRFARGDWQALGKKDSEKAAWRTSSTDQHSNLPVSITSFVGRIKEQGEVIQLLRKNRLVTLAGAGGIGKTRLAIQVGQQLLQDFPDGVWFVPLESLSDPLLVPHTLASVLGIRGSGIREGGNQPIMETLKDVLHWKTSLLILDNCEHLLDACVQLARSLLTHCPSLRILTTSREILNMEGEAIHYLPSLSTPEESTSLEELADYESVQLFIERAALALSTFQLTEANAPAVLDICRRMDGIPLAIELTAACVNILKVEEISKQLHKSFAILTSGHRATLSRHQTMQASLDWSWSLLTDAERVFLGQLSIFASGWTLEAAEAVCDGDILILTNALVQKSLIRVKQESEYETRYEIHEIVRRYAHNKLLDVGGVEAIRYKHLAYFVKLAEQAEPELYRSNQVFWFNKLDDERDNLRIALEWALATDVKSGLRIVSIPWRYWQRHDYREWGDLLKKFLERYPRSDSLRAQSLAVSSTYFFVYGNAIEAREAAEQALQLSRTLSDRQNEALSLLFLGRSIAFPGNYEEGTPFMEQSLALYRELGDQIGEAVATGWMGINHNDLEHSKKVLSKSLKLHRELGNLSGIAWCLTFLAYYAIFEGDFSSPAPWLEEAKTLYHELGDLPGEADVLETMGMLADRQRDYPKAYSYFEQAIALYEKVGGIWSSWTRVRMGHACLRQGDFVRAGKLFETTIQQFQKVNNLMGVAYTVEGIASLYVNQEQLERAVRLFAWADATRKKVGDHRPPVEQADVNQDITTCIAKMGETAFSDAYEEGSTMALEEAVAYALEKI